MSDVSNEPIPADYPLDFAYAYGEPLGSADFRAEPEDFIVEEQLGFEPAGDGEHLLLHVRKRNQNTRWVAEQLADIAGIQPMDVGYCGMKDRRAVTSQWFSLYLPKRDFDVQALESVEGITLLGSARHNRKLRRGEHAANRFQITLRNCTASEEELAKRLTAITEGGVPNYFGEQRFGHDGGNLQEFAKRLVGVSGDQRAQQRGRGKRNRRGGRQRNDAGIYLSAGRSYLFNRILSARVIDGSWCQPLPGEEQPTGALWGRGRIQGSEALVALEQSALAALPGWGDALEHSGLSQERRALALRPEDFCWQFGDGNLVLSFGLAPGCFATSVLRELTQLNTPQPGTDRAARDIVQD